MATSNRCSGAACARGRVLVLIIIAGVLAFIISAISPSDDGRQHEAMRSAKVLRISIKSTKSISAQYAVPDTFAVAVTGVWQLRPSRTASRVTATPHGWLIKIVPAVLAVRAPPTL